MWVGKQLLKQLFDMPHRPALDGDEWRWMVLDGVGWRCIIMPPPTDLRINCQIKKICFEYSHRPQDIFLSHFASH
jgi:hypothetical protein